jgi:ADP-ribosylglycohydrolase
VEVSEALYNGADYRSTGCKHSNDNGSAMRSAPIGLLFASRSVNELRTIVYQLSSITHASIRSMAAATAVAFAAKFMHCCRLLRFDMYAFVDFVSQTGDEQMDLHLRYIPELLKLSTSEARQKCLHIGMQDGESLLDGVTQTVLWSLHCVCKHPNDFTQCIGETIGVGGDVNTTAAIAGALVGARLGISAIPMIWRTKLNDLDEWQYNDLCIMVEDVIQLSRKSYTVFEHKTHHTR